MLNLKAVSAWIPLLAGLCILVLASQTAWLAVVLAAIPVALMIAGGTRSMLFTDQRAPQLAVIGAVLGVLLALPLGLAGGRSLGFTSLALSALAFIAGGWFRIRLQPALDEVPVPPPTPIYSAKVALDDAMLGVMSAISPPYTPDVLRNAVQESEAAYAFFAERGYLEEPRTFHTSPPEITSPTLDSMSIRGHNCEYLRFDSDYEPDGRLPGRDRWLSYAENRTSHALILRHGKPGPWLVCVHGFGMGNLKQDFQTFRAAQMYRGAGVNVALCTLPVHGPRSPGGFSGEKFFGASVMDFVHAETQAVWDLRRLIAWIRRQEATQVGVFGLSLGGYTSALLSSIEEDLACVITAVPPTDMMAQFEYYAGSCERRIADIAGVNMEHNRAVNRVVSPLVLSPLVPHGGRFIFAATGDQFVPIEQVRALWLHWGRPRISWSTGGHLSVFMQREFRRLVDEALAAAFKSESMPEPQT